MWTLISLVFPLILNCNGEGLSSVSYDYNQLYKGNRCQLKNGAGEGTCVKVIECPSVLQEIYAGYYTGADRCGFEDFVEIVCCATQPTLQLTRNKIRPAEAACQEYKQIPEKSNFEAMATVYNGARAHPFEFPHMAALGYSASEKKADGGVKYICGGTLISQKHVLTAAHCVSNIHGLIPEEVVLGTNDLDNLEAEEVQRIPISRIIKHPGYKRALSYHDLAILELEYTVKFTHAVYPTCLLTEPLTRRGGNRHISFAILGWGASDSDGTPSTKLLKAENLKFVNKKRCCKRYANIRTNIPNGLDDAMICVRDPDTSRRADTCSGDSGGPLLIGSNRFPRVVGVTSFGHACGGIAPGVYTSVYKNLDWIEGQVWPNSD